MTFTPAAADTITSFFDDHEISPLEYDAVLTGDLGSVGSELLLDILKNDKGLDISSVHKDCGKMIYDTKKQDVHAGGSGCGCSAVVLCSKILKELSEGYLKKILFVGTGALMSPLILLQGESIPGIAHAVELYHV